MKSDRLKKLENELHDLQQWMKLGLVPKKDLEKHKDEIQSLEQKIEEEKERLRYLKESGALDEFVQPKKSAANRQSYQDTPTLPDMDIGGEGLTDVGLDMETETFDFETTTTESDEEYESEGGTQEESNTTIEDDDPFSDRNRWRRGILEDPDANDW